MSPQKRIAREPDPPYDVPWLNLGLAGGCLLVLLAGVILVTSILWFMLH